MTTTHTVGDLARRAGVTVRTLHHYDEIGLLSPSDRSAAGYRLYDTGDVSRLQQILFYRELGLPLDEITRIMSNPEFDRTAALREQRARLEAKARHLHEMIEAVDTAIDAHEKGTTMSTDDMLGVFGDFDPKEYEEEARERWGHTDAYKESARRTAAYTKEDWERLSDEAAEIYAAFMSLKDAGVTATSDEAMAVAERHRAHIGDWFYECTPDIHVGLGEMYAADPRFTENIDQHGEGLAAYMSEAILANGVRLVG
jgi:DNA-binding transcriptional MerR regulator